MSKEAKSLAIESAMSVADDIAAGKLKPDALEQHARDTCRRLFGHVSGPGDPLWDLQVEVTRQALALGEFPVNELSEWLGLARWREENANSRVVPAEAETVVGVVNSPAHVTSAAELDRVERELLAAAAEGAQSEPEPEVNPYGSARRIVARGRGGPADNGLRPM